MSDLVLGACEVCQRRVPLRYLDKGPHGHVVCYRPSCRKIAGLPKKGASYERA